MVRRGCSVVGASGNERSRLCGLARPRRRDSVRRTPHEFAALRVRLGCTTLKAALARNIIPSQSGFPLVGVTGFEPATSSSRTMRATKLRHTPMALEADEQSIRVRSDQPFESAAVRVSIVTSGGQANR